MSNPFVIATLAALVFMAGCAGPVGGSAGGSNLDAGVILTEHCVINAQNEDAESYVVLSCTGKDTVRAGVSGCDPDWPRRLDVVTGEDAGATFTATLTVAGATAYEATHDPSSEGLYWEDADFPTRGPGPYHLSLDIHDWSGASSSGVTFQFRCGEAWA